VQRIVAQLRDGALITGRIISVDVICVKSAATVTVMVLVAHIFTRMNGRLGRVAKI
jgi:hypothetical protein